MSLRARVLHFFTQYRDSNTFKRQTISFSKMSARKRHIFRTYTEYIMKKTIIGIIGAAILALGAIFVVGQQKVSSGEHFGGKGHGRKHHGMMGMALKGLDLTNEQKAKVKEIFEASRASVEPLLEQMKANHAKIRDLGTNGSFDQAAVEAIANEQGSITAKLIIEKEKAKSQVFAILTDEQKAKTEAMRAKFEEKMKDRKPFGKAPTGAEF